MRISDCLLTGLCIAASAALLPACGDDDAKSGVSATGGTGGASGATGTGGSGTGGSGTGGSGTGGSSTGGGGTGGSGTADAGTGGAQGEAGPGAQGEAGADGSVSGDAGDGAGPRRILAAVGGTITIDGLVIDIPAGALSADTDITVQVSDGASLPEASTLVAKVYELGPDGTTFTKPVALTIAVDAAKLGAKIPVVSYLAGGAWTPLTDSAVVGGDVTAHTTHFTSFGVVGSDAAACDAKATRADCHACCQATFVKGAAEADPLTYAIKYCACTTGAPCEAECTGNVCAGQAPTTQCQTCLQTQGGAVPQAACITQGQNACSTSTDCMDYTICQVNCP